MTSDGHNGYNGYNGHDRRCGPVVAGLRVGGRV